MASNALGPASTLPIHATREMHAQEGEPRIGHRVNQVLDEVAPFASNLVILSAERNNLQIDVNSGELRDLIAVEPGAVNDMAGAKRTGGRLDYVFVAVATQAQSPSPGK